MQTTEFEQIRYQKIPGLKIFLTEVIHPTTRHFHEELELLLVLDGTLCVTAGNREMTARRGDFIFFNSYESHYIASLNQKGLLLVIQTPPNFCGSYFSGLSLCLFQKTVFPSQKYQELKDLSLQIAREFWEEKEGYALACIGYLNLVAACLLRLLPFHKIDSLEEISRSGKIQRMNHMLDYIREHFCEKLLLSDVAAYENLSLHYLSHFFKETMGISFQDYVKQLRFEKALKLVAETEENLLDICLSCGFSDSRYFYSMFRKYFRCTPSEYRKSHRKETPLSLPGFPQSGALRTQISQIIEGNQAQLALLDFYTQEL